VIPRLGVRARLAALYAGLLALTTAVLLGLSWLLMDRHLHRTLPERLADDSAETLAVQYVLAFLGASLIAVALGWLVAGRVLAPIRRMTERAHGVTDERLDSRIAVEGPQDELRELGETLDAMLDRLQSSLDAQRHFVANASHELRSPLTVIRTETEVTLADPDASADDFREMGRIVLEATDRTEALLDGLMVLARSQRGLLRTDPVDLCLVARRAAAGGMAAARAASVRIEVEADSTATVTGDESLLERLVANLVDNGVRYNAPGGWVVVQCGRDGRGDAVVEVANSGPVVPADSVERLTQPFERLDRARDSKGSGLGLSIVRAVAEAHGGRLGLAARPDGGLRVRVAFGSDLAV
jgi:signal transduction histidine kinase